MSLYILSLLSKVLNYLQRLSNWLRIIKRIFGLSVNMIWSPKMESITHMGILNQNPHAIILLELTYCTLHHISCSKSLAFMFIFMWIKIIRAISTTYCYMLRPAVDLHFKCIYHDMCNTDNLIVAFFIYNRLVLNKMYYVFNPCVAQSCFFLSFLASFSAISPLSSKSSTEFFLHFKQHILNFSFSFPTLFFFQFMTHSTSFLPFFLFCPFLTSSCLFLFHFWILSLVLILANVRVTAAWKREQRRFLTSRLAAPDSWVQQ